MRRQRTHHRYNQSGNITPNITAEHQLIITVMIRRSYEASFDRWHVVSFGVRQVASSMIIQFVLILRFVVDRALNQPTNERNDQTNTYIYIIRTYDKGEEVRLYVYD